MMEDACITVANSIYGFPPISDLAAAYSAFFILSFVPWLISWAAARIINAIQLFNS